MSTIAPLKYLTVPAARGKHTATVIFVHGLGDSGHGWKPVAYKLSVNPDLQHIKWVLPHAPVMAVTANMGMTMPSWFDIFSFDLSTEDEPGMLKTVHSLNQLISAEIEAGVPAERIVLGGFSQGGAMSLLTGLTTERKLGGVAVLSGWLPLQKKFKAMINDYVKELPLFWGHGVSDPLIKYQYAVASIDFLKSQVGVSEVGVPAPPVKPIGLSFHGYTELQHSTCEEEIDDLSEWLSNVIPTESSTA